MPMSSSFERSTFDASASSCWFISTSVGCTTCTATPVRLQPRRRLEPEQPAADDHRGPVLRDVGEHPRRVVERLRNPNTPRVSSVFDAHMPSMGGKNERLPVARTSVSYGVTEPSSPKTTLACRSMRTIRTPACSVMPFSSYQSRGLR